MRWKWFQWLASAQLAHSGNGKFSVNLRNSFVFWMTPFPIWKLIKILHSIYILCCCQSVFIVPKMEWNVFLCWQFRCYWCQIERVSRFDSFILLCCIRWLFTKLKYSTARSFWIWNFYLIFSEWSYRLAIDQYPFIK